MKNFQRFAGVLLALFVFAASAFAQGSTGRLVGTVTDPGGAIVPGATVTVKDAQTGRERTITASSEGTFSVPQLESGTYTVTITAQGFSTFTATDLKIDAGRDYTLNATLQVGNVKENVTVVAGADIVNSTDASLSTTVGSRQVKELPINGRNPLALLNLLPGVNPTSSSINGQRSSSTNYTRDGLNVQDNFIRTGGFVQDRPTVDDTGEFTATLQNASAEFGGSQVVQLVTPRGESKFHGAVYEFNRNSYFGANSFFNNFNNLPRPFLNRNQFGATVSGPAILPHFGEGGHSFLRKHAFFFANYEDFPQGVNFNISTPVTRNAVTGRFDVQVNERNAFNFIYKRNNESNARNDLAFGFQTLPFVFQGGPTKLYIGAYNWTPTARFSNELRGGYQRSEPFFAEGGVPSDFVFSNAQTQSANTLAGIITNPEGSFRSQGRNTDYWNLQDNANYTWGNHSLRFGGQLQAYKTVALNFFGVTPLFTISSTSNPNTPGFSSGLFPGGINTTDLARANNLRYLLGGIIGSAGVTANLVNIQTGFQRGAPTSFDLRYQNYSFYGQDQWRISPRLTLNLGLRYELFTPLKNPDRIYLEAAVLNGETAQQAALDPNGVYQIVGGNAGNPGAFFKTDKNNFGPTVSLAWSPTFKNKFLGSAFPGEGKTVIRGGYRISYNSDEYERAPDNALQNHTGLGSQTVNATLNGTTSLRSVLTPRADAPSFAAVPGNFPTPTVPTTPFPYTVNNTGAFNFFGTVFVIDPKLQVPLTHEYNFGIQREIGWQSAIEIRYVGARSHQLVRTIDFNQVDIRNNGFLADFNRARSNLTTFGSAGCTATQAAATGCQQLTVFPNLAAGGLLTNSTILTQIQNGVPADLAIIYVQNGLAGNVRFLANPSTGVANVLGNGGQFNYNALQVEIRRRPAQGLSYQVNYTFQKPLADSTQESQTNVDPFLDNANLRLNYSRPNYDRTHTINANLNLELPFGHGRRWLSDGWASKVFGGFQLTSILNISSGEPTSIRDPRGTLNRAGRSALQPATSSLTPDQIKKLIGIFRTPNGVFFIDPSVLQATATNGTVTQIVDLRQQLPAAV